MLLRVEMLCLILMTPAIIGFFQKGIYQIVVGFTENKMQVTVFYLLIQTFWKVEAILKTMCHLL